MRSSIRPTTPADAIALGALMAEAGLQPNSEPAHLEWKYWRARADRPDQRSFVMVRGDEILAHAAVVPGVCLSGAASSFAQRVRTLHLIDWAARPSATGAGVSLMKHVAQGTDALLAIGGSAQTLQLLPHLGFRRVGAATCYVRPLHPLRLLGRSQHPAVKILPRLARSMYWKLRAPSRGRDGWQVRQIGAGELLRLAAVVPVPRPGVSVFERGDELFRYTLECPITDMSLHVLERDGNARGYFLLAYAFRQVRLADCWMSSEDPADWRSLVQCAVATAAGHPRAAELAAWASDTALSQRLLECGFHVRDELPLQILAPRNGELTDAELRVQMLDNDAAYRHLGRNELWA